MNKLNIVLTEIITIKANYFFTYAYQCIFYIVLLYIF